MAAQVVTQETLKRIISDITEIVKNPLHDNGIYYEHDESNMLKGYVLIIPTNKSGEFFGFYNTFGRAGSVMGPALVGMFIGIFNNLHIALVPIIVLFIAGGFLLRYVKYPNEII